MRQLDVSICIIQQGDSYLLQKRADDPRIGAAGLIGAFGGKIEHGEQPVEAACREVCEETNLAPTVEQLHKLGSYVVMSDHKLEPVSVNIDAFLCGIDSDMTVEAKEGSVVRLTQPEAMANLHAMTPATKVCFETIIGKETSDVPTN